MQDLNASLLEHGAALCWRQLPDLCKLDACSNMPLLSIKRWQSKMSAAAAAKSLQSCPTLCDPIDGSPPGLPVPGILQARTLKWATTAFSNAWKWKVKVKVKLLSHLRLFVTPWTVAYQALPSLGFSRQQYWSGLPLPSPKVSADSVKCLLWGKIILT